jgi:hypothetical protein
VLALGALLAGCNGLDSSGPAGGRPVQGEPAPDAAGEDSNGQPLRISAYRGQVVMLSFWSAS